MNSVATHELTVLNKGRAILISGCGRTEKKGQATRSLNSSENTTEVVKEDFSPFTCFSCIQEYLSGHFTGTVGARQWQRSCQRMFYDRSYSEYKKERNKMCLWCKFERIFGFQGLERCFLILGTGVVDWGKRYAEILFAEPDIKPMNCEEAHIKSTQPSVEFDSIITWSIHVAMRSKAYVYGYLSAGDRGFESRWRLCSLCVV
jgi:hypothetical protein